MDFLTGSPDRTEDTDLAAALTAIGIPLRRERPIKRLQGAREAVTYYFEHRSTCGAYETGEMVRRWDDHAWQQARPRHPLSYLRLMFRNHRRILEHERDGVKVGALRRAGKVELITLREGRPIRGEQNPPVSGPEILVVDSWLAAALLACGISPVGSCWRPGSYRFMHGSPCGGFLTGALALAWQDDTWHQRHPEHPFAYLICGAGNRAWLLQKIRGIEPTVCFLQRNGLPAFLHASADGEAQRRFFRHLK